MCVLILKDNLWFKAIEENSNECTKIDKVFDKERK